MRGNRGAALRRSIGGRSIPAYAGEPGGWSIRRALPGVYPRVCGGTFCAGLRGQSEGGLSPRMRGNHIPSADKPGKSGSIPAYAGEPGSLSLV